MVKGEGDRGALHWERRKIISSRHTVSPFCVQGTMLALEARGGPGRHWPPPGEGLRGQGRGSSLAEAPPREGPGTPSNSSEFLQGSQTHGPHLRFLPQNCGVPSGRPQRPPLLIRHILEPAVASPVPSLETPPRPTTHHCPGTHRAFTLPCFCPC